MQIIQRIFFTLAFFITLLSSGDALAQRWEQIALPSQFADNYWLDVYFLPSNPQLGWICGRQGKVLRTFDGGDSWIGTIIPGIDTLESIHFPTPLIGYASGPGGIFRSVDGGASWRSVKPDSARELWGCYFISADTGVVIGGGCVDNRQYFFRTTDGGATWNFSTGNVRGSGLADAVLLSGSGRGYAASSGYLWKTDNGGKTWDTLSSTGAKYWQEELCVYRNSFLLPAAGVTCGGGGMGGGMRFSRNGGYTWSEFQTGEYMFGSFLLNDSTGWAVGLKRNIWHTTNYGATWELQNCGAGQVDFDDVWMINENTGWAVGSSVYRLSPPFRSITRTSLDFGETCYPGSRYDTLFIKIESFSQTTGILSISGENASDYEIIEPAATSFTVRPCDSARVVIKFSPSLAGDLQADLTIKMPAPFFTEFTVPLAGKGRRTMSQISDTILNMGYRPCGRFSYDSIRFLNPSPDPETISWIDYLSSRDEIRPISSIPQTIFGGRDAAVAFRTYFTDTGTVVNTYRFWIGACPRILTVKATGYSPIITTPFSRVIGLGCNPDQLDTMLVSNTGNAPLLFSDIRVSGQNAADFSIVGRTDQAPLLRAIQPKQSVGFIVKFAPSTAGPKKMQLIFKNNDSTLARGDRSTLVTMYQGGLSGSAVKLASADSINGGLLCPGMQSVQRIIVRNIGGSSAFLSYISPLKQGLRSSIVAGQLPREIKNGDSLVISIFFTPQTPGVITDSVTLRFEPCNDIIRVALHCEGITSQLSVTPDSVIGNIPIGILTKRTITVRSTGTDAAIISSINLAPPRSDWRLINLPKLPFVLPPNKDTSIILEFSPDRDTTFAGKICFVASELCDASACVPIEVSASGTTLELSASNISFPDNFCDNPSRTKQIALINKGFSADTLIELAITSGSPDFTVIAPNTPIAIKAGDTVLIQTECRQRNEGVVNGELLLRSVKAKQTPFLLPLRAKFEKSDLSANTTGIFFNEVEQCDTIRSVSARIFNKGNVTETISITRLGALPVFDITPRAPVQIPPNDSIEIEILCNPAAASSAGLYTETLRISGDVCKHSFIIPTAVNIVIPKLTVAPDSITFGSLISGDDSARAIYIFNRGERPVKIENISLSVGGQGFTIASLPTLPRSLLPEESDSVVINFHANSAGVFNDRLLVYGGSICSSLTEASLNAETDNRAYRAHVFIERYDAVPGDSISIMVKMQGSLVDAFVHLINAYITYDPKLFYLESVTINDSGRQIDIPFIADSAGVKFQIKDTYNFPLGKDGVIAALHGLALFSLPDTCTLGIGWFNAQSRRPAIITRSDGFLQARSLCGPLAGFTPLPVASAILLNANSGFDSRINLRLSANAPVEAAITVRNVFGELAYHASGLQVGNYDCDYMIDAAAFPSGPYFLEISASGITERHNIVIIH